MISSPRLLRRRRLRAMRTLTAKKRERAELRQHSGGHRVRTSASGPERRRVARDRSPEGQFGRASTEGFSSECRFRPGNARVVDPACGLRPGPWGLRAPQTVRKKPQGIGASARS